MRFLLDNCLSPSFKPPMVQAGHDVEHVRDVGLARADDSLILDFARLHDRVILTEDRDFTVSMALSGAVRPSLVYLRLVIRRPANQIQHLLRHLPSIEAPLLQGAVAVITEAGCRVRTLPIP